MKEKLITFIVNNHYRLITRLCFVGFILGIIGFICALTNYHIIQSIILLIQIIMGIFVYKIDKFFKEKL